VQGSGRRYVSLGLVQSSNQGVKRLERTFFCARAAFIRLAILIYAIVAVIYPLNS
jgi:hypothetical protein